MWYGNLKNQRVACTCLLLNPLCPHESESKHESEICSVCLTLCDPMDYTVHGISQARILEWVALPFSRGSSQPSDQTQVSKTTDRFFTNWVKPLCPHKKRQIIIGKIDETIKNVEYTLGYIWYSRCKILKLYT